MKKYQKTLGGKFTEYKTCAKKRGVFFKLSKKEFTKLWNKPCAYCGADIATIGIDRICNDKGYEDGNVISCCDTCNKMKSTWSVEEFKEHILLLSRRVNDWPNI